MQPQTTAFCLSIIIKRIYCGSREKLQPPGDVICFPTKSEYNKISHRQILTEVNWTRCVFLMIISIHSSSLYIIKKLYSPLFKQTLISQCHICKQEVVRQKPFQIKIFFSSTLITAPHYTLYKCSYGFSNCIPPVSKGWFSREAEKSR